MTDRNNIQNELKNLNSDLSANSDGTPFAVPDGYFKGLAASILTKAKTQDSTAAQELAELSPLLASLSKAIPYDVPNDYFGENLSTLPFLFEEEKSTILSSLGKSMPYEVPVGYFQNFPQQVLSKLTKTEGKVVSLFSRPWMRVAAAAVVGGIIFISGYQYFNKAGDTRTASQQAVDTSNAWVAKNDQSVLSDLKKVSKKDLEDFIQTVPLRPTETKDGSSASVNKEEIKKLMEGVSKKEIDNFLEQLPNVDDDLAIIN